MSTAGVFWSRNLCLSVIMLLRTKFCVNQTINRPDIAGERFSLWRPSAMFNLQNCGSLSCDRPCKRNLRLHTKLRWNLMSPGWVIVINHFQNGGRPPSWIFEIWYFGDVSCVRTWFCWYWGALGVLILLKICRRVRVCFDPVKCHILSFKTVVG